MFILTSGQVQHWSGLANKASLKILVEGTDFKCGNTKIFIKEPKTIFELESQRQLVLPAVASSVQAPARRLVYLQRYRRTRRGIIKIQAAMRGFLAQLHYHNILMQIESIQSVIRGFNSRRLTLKFRVQFKNQPPRIYATPTTKLAATTMPGKSKKPAKVRTLSLPLSPHPSYPSAVLEDAFREVRDKWEDRE